LIYSKKDRERERRNKYKKKKINSHISNISSALSSSKHNSSYKNQKFQIFLHKLEIKATKNGVGIHKEKIDVELKRQR